MNARVVPLAAAIAMALSPLAATATPQNADKEKPAKDENLERIKVTGKYTVSQNLDSATGLGLTLRETPQSVSIMTDERMFDQNIDTVLEVVNNAVGVSASEMDNVRNTFYARGFEISNYQIDGVPTSWSIAGDAGETIADVAIYERVEFVRGATGLLTGVGDPSASINLVRKHATSKEFEGYINASVGRWNSKQVTADVGSALNASGSIRGRAVIKVDDSESHVDFLEESKEVFYGVVEADITNSTLLRVGGSYQHHEPKGAMWGFLPAFYSDGTYTDWDVSKTTGADWTNWETTSTNYFVNLNHVFDNGWELLANYNGLKADKTSKLLYINGSDSQNLLDKETGTGLKAQRYNSDGENSQNSFDVQLKGQFSGFGRLHDLVIGALYSEHDKFAHTFNPQPLGGDGTYDQVPVGNFYEWPNIEEPQWSDEPTPGEDTATEEKGFYAATRLALSDSLKLVVGGRVSSWDRDGVSYGTVVDYGDSGVFVPYAGLLYDLTDNHRLYASFTEIFNPQNRKDTNGNFLDPLEGQSNELGLKSTFLNDRLHTSIAVFKIEQDNLAVVDPNHESTPELQTAYIAEQGTESTGFEAEIVGQPVDGWNISAGYSQHEAENANGMLVNTDTPDKLFKLFTTYQFVEFLPELTIGGGANWQGDVYSTGMNPATLEMETFTQDAYWLVNLMARYKLSDNMSLQLNVANLFDEKYYSQAGFAYGYRYGTPRDYTLSFNYKF
ncbi:TonB-dependent siderophore receptor [Idiomarina loihiensis]|jgi:outer membrane receptor for ferric coprogen and ferric-rhodotorulic acid|uniref:Outer membrane receptor for ferric siderophore n=1 Tax=Idiomarina loihiensis (strain ATCC BAA-735 / DSM 15497 / L2-TR) TaxID=283942 RepID=Q5QUA0_IDILO|nr:MULTISPECIES: TonB-dependent siderophore receptor [Idiomarina]AAV82417.1 Outer membrane receptor for ferric siderophore [Idiomarina loihiensis L2TR]AGM36453.1 Outer membrane receptor for ferric siderophore [Idiomarina loihiensis GSL 199]NWO03060.1 TonB-dependent siderophore receptor [Idiomarinaceae bacterium]PHQ90862.1 MAG: TonB-dependent siderophore receptor [Idiomarina sp.]